MTGPSSVAALVAVLWSWVGCRQAPLVATKDKAVPAPSVSARPAPREDASYFPLVEGATYEYDAVFGAKTSHERRIVRAAKTAMGRVFYFADEGVPESDNASIGSNSFGLGAYRVSTSGVETAEAYWRDDLPKVSAMVPLVQFPPENGAVTSVMGGKQLETTVVGPESVTVPAGTFTCLRLDQREIWTAKTHEGSVWLARGIGTVKRVYVTGRTETLTRFQIP